METEEQVERDARQLRREMRMRGHVVGPHYNTICVHLAHVQWSQISVLTNHLCTHLPLSEHLARQHAMYFKVLSRGASHKAAVL